MILTFVPLLSAISGICLDFNQIPHAIPSFNEFASCGPEEIAATSNPCKTK
jgi:hypothetical protein